jgi:predicted secreted Zn-dependent protease
MFYRIIKIGLLIFLSIAASSPSLFSIIKTKESEEYYPVSADGLSRLHWKLKRVLITDNYGNKFIAKTDWDVAWQVHTLSDIERCFVSDVIVDISIKYTYPKWSDIAFAPRTDRYLWNRFIDALRKHEEGHALIGKEAGTMIEKALLEIKPAANCTDLETFIRNKADAIHQGYIAKNAIYDEETMHGKNQGAILP